MDPNWIIAAATLVAGPSALWAANESRKSAKAALHQVKLQRPRPLIVIDWRWDVNDSDRLVPQALLLSNIGDSPAFDIEISDLQIQTANNESHVLQTAPIRFIIPDREAYCSHDLRGNSGVHNFQQPLSYFVRKAKDTFISSRPVTDPRLVEPYYDSLLFRLDYRAADGHKLTCECALRFSLVAVWVEPVSSWAPPI